MRGPAPGGARAARPRGRAPAAARRRGGPAAGTGRHRAPGRGSGQRPRWAAGRAAPGRGRRRRHRRRRRGHGRVDRGPAHRHPGGSASRPSPDRPGAGQHAGESRAARTTTSATGRRSRVPAGLSDGTTQARAAHPRAGDLLHGPPTGHAGPGQEGQPPLDGGGPSGEVGEEVLPVAVLVGVLELVEGCVLGIEQNPVPSQESLVDHLFERHRHHLRIVGRARRRSTVARARPGVAGTWRHRQRGGDRPCDGRESARRRQCAGEPDSCPKAVPLGGLAAKDVGQRHQGDPGEEGDQRHRPSTDWTNR